MIARRIELICGCMFSGKTTELIRRVSAYPCGARVVTLKPSIDQRYSPTDIVSHDGQALAARVVRDARGILEAAHEVDVVVVDEIHFLDDGVVEVCRELADRGVDVVCCGLDRDMWGHEFPHVRRLSEIADTTVLHAVCSLCGRQADRTQRTTPLLDDNLVGGCESFEPRCQRCFTPPPVPKPADRPPGLA